MIPALQDILKSKYQNDGKTEKILKNIEKRLQRRLPDGAELSLTAFQEKAVRDPLFWRDWNDDARSSHLMIQGATSAGKTLLSELNILDTLYHHQKAIVLVPLKAMVHERTVQFREDMGHGLTEYDITVYGSSSDYMENDESIINGEYDVAIIVYEKFFAMLSQGYAKMMDKCGLLVVDELSMLGLEQRGPKLEMALEIVREKYTDVRIMCMATCDCSTKRICEWLNIPKPILSTARPVALEEHITELNGSGIYRMIPKNHESADESDIIEAEEKLDIPGYKPDQKLSEKKQQLLLTVISKIYSDTPDAKVLVFVSTRAEASRTADFLKETVTKWSPRESGGKQIDEAFLSALRACDRDEGQAKLIDELIPCGIAYHHAGLSTTLRELIEEQFPKSHSNLRVIVATETLTVGVNMPFDAMIMLSHLVWRGTGAPVPLTMQEYRNYIGRAGRLGQSNRIGKTYLFVENASDREYYRKSYSDKEEVTSALTKSDAEALAPYYLSLLNNQLGNKHTVGTKFTLDDLRALFDQSLSKICGNKKFDAQALYETLYCAYLASEAQVNTGAKKRGVTVREEYAIERFGSHMAPYAFSIDTCVKIFWYFYEGYKNGALPLGITRQDIESDRYLLDILYHVCCHQEIVASSNLIYPMEDSNVTRSFVAKGKVLEGLRDILSEKDQSGDPRYVLWCDAHSGAQQETDDLWLLLNRSNLTDESLKLQAAMRAIVLFYWTKGYSISRIREKTGFDTFTKIISGDIERLAEVASFHLDAIHKCLGSARDAARGKDVCENSEALKEFYALQTRVKYGMPRDLVVFANKHVHGLDRKRLLKFKECAEDAHLTPVQYLYVTSVGRIPEDALTPSQHMQLKQALERCGSVKSIDTLMGIIEKDPGAKLTDSDMRCLRAIASWNDTDRSETPDAGIIYTNLKSVGKTSPLKSVSVYTDGNSHRIVWKMRESELHIGVLCSEKKDPDLLDFFLCEESEESETALAKILIVPHSFTSEQMKEALKTYRADAVLDNVYLFFLLANTLRLQLDDGYALTAFLADLRGIFTMADYSYFPLSHYLRREVISSPSYRLLCGSDGKLSTENALSAEALLSLLGACDDLKNYEILPHGCALLSEAYDFAECPTVILLNRCDVTRSQSLTKFLFVMRNQNFKNCILLLDSEEAKEEWIRAENYADDGSTCWNSQFNRIIPMSAVCGNVESAMRKVREYLKNWKHEGYLIGISYAHYDSVPSEELTGWKNDIDKLTLLAKKLSEEYGEHRILFDRFSPACKLFDANRGREKALSAYETCKFYLVLWNFFTKENRNCRDERKIILNRCSDDSCGCLFLQTGRPDDPEVPQGYYSEPLSESNIDFLVMRTKELIKELTE